MRCYSGLVPALDSSGLRGRHGPTTKRGDAVLREALFMAADQARRLDPVLAAKYHRLMVTAGKHHTSALCHIAAALLTRTVACWRSRQPYQLRDLDGIPVTREQARGIIADRYTVPAAVREARSSTRTGRRNQGPRHTPSTGPSNSHDKTPTAA